MISRRTFLFSAATSPYLAKSGQGSGSRPNIVLILADDLGYSDLGCYGGEVETPHLDQLAAEGVRFTHFFNTARCCPSRASLLTGLYSHQVGVGFMDADWHIPSYQGHLRRDCATLPEAMRARGYRTIMSGKWHLGTAAPDLPWARGFDHVYGIPQGGGVYFWPPQLDRDVVRFDRDSASDPIKTSPDEKFYSTDAFTDHAVEQIRAASEKRQPFFLYVPYVAPHFPQQAWEKDVRKYLGRYRQGWQRLREARAKRQKALGIIDTGTKLSPGDGLDWETLNEEQVTQLDRQMSVYAAQVNNMDQNIGRILGALRETGAEKNTLVIFLSDNGAQRNGPMGNERNKGAVFGTRDSFGQYAQGWANLCNTPFRRYKEEEYQGGNAAPLIVRWPGRIPVTGAILHQASHIIDLVPTILDAVELDRTSMAAGGHTQRLEGISLIPFFEGGSEVSRTLFWEHMGNRAVRQGDWKLVAAQEGAWELYDLKADPTELSDLSRQYPDKVKTLTGLYFAWAQRCGVLTLPEIERRRKGVD